MSDALAGLDVAWPRPRPAPGAASTGLVITTWNRPGYVRRSFRSLARSGLRDVVVVVVDDASDDRRTRRLVQDLALPVPVVRMWRRERREPGIHRGLLAGWSLCAGELGCELLANLDSDAIVRPGWLDVERALFRRESARRGAVVVTGFHAVRHRVRASHADFREKESVGGMNLLFDRAVYEAHVREALAGRNWDWRLVRALEAAGVPMLTTRPSVAQHIGRRGLFSSAELGFDVATDWWVDAPAVELAARAVGRASREIVQRTRAIVKKLRG
ncbi:MAG: glycosyltransferase [Deltaproteobacteria bacterium]|nr:glycosyltransferase [Deltaproteobacteria bacterium]